MSPVSPLSIQVAPLMPATVSVKVLPQTPLPGAVVWSGHAWTIRADGTAQNPGPNNWKAANVSFPGGGVLRMQLTTSAGQWYCCEIDGTEHLGYGQYRWIINTNLGSVQAPPIILGMFTYDSSAASPFREIDIETEWGFTVQPPSETQNEPFTYNSSPPYTCDVIWQPGQVYFAIADLSAAPLHRHCVIEGVPVPGLEVPIMNLWLGGGVAPAAPITVDFASFTFTKGATFVKPKASTRHIPFTLQPLDLYPYGTATTSGGYANIPCLTGYTAYVDGDHMYDLTNSSLSIQVQALPPVGLGTTEARFYAYYDANNFLLASKTGSSPTILMRKCEAGVNTDFFLVYSSSYTYWRWVETGGNTVVFQTSPDNVSWTSQATIPHTMPSKLSNIRCRLMSGYYGAETSPGPFQVSAVNP